MYHIKNTLTILLINATSQWRLILSGLYVSVALAACGGDDSTSTVAKDDTHPTPAPFQWPADHAVVDPNQYAGWQDPKAMKSAAYQNGPNGGPGTVNSDDIANAGLDLKAIDETPAVKHHSMIGADGQTIEYSATAGHLIAWTPKSESKAAGPDAQASIFYMAYTRDDVPHNQRPVMFIFNGGPGEPSIWLHLGSWAPHRLLVNAPNLPAGPEMPDPDRFPLIDNPQTLLDQTDLVFIDLPGSGYSEAIAPHKNSDFWNTDADAKVFRDFITAYINRNNRQSSPKYLMGESYSGIRTPIVADLLVQAGTSNYLPDPSKATPQVLTGVILQSPIMDYGYRSTSSDQAEGFLPTLGMVVDYYGKATARNGQSKTDYATYLRNFASGDYAQGLQQQIFSTNVATTLSGITGLPENSLSPDGRITDFLSIGKVIYPNNGQNPHFNAYDGRMSTTDPINYDISFYEDAGFYGNIKQLLLSEFGYQNKDPKQVYGSDIAADYWWNDSPIQHRGSPAPTSVPDLVEALTLQPTLKALVFHGYHDGVTPFFQTELDLGAVGLWSPTSPVPRVTVKEYDGGHMAYLTEASRSGMRSDLRSFLTASTTSSSMAATSITSQGVAR